MIRQCENCKENGKIQIKNARKSKFRKTYLSKYSCDGNVKLLGQKRVIPNCCQINFRKSRRSLVAFASILEKLLTFKVSAGTFSPPPPPSQGLIGLKERQGD